MFSASYQTSVSCAPHVLAVQVSPTGIWPSTSGLPSNSSKLLDCAFMALGACPWWWLCDCVIPGANDVQALSAVILVHFKRGPFVEPANDQVSSAAQVNAWIFLLCDTRGFFFISVNYRLCNLGIKEQRVITATLPSFSSFSITLSFGCGMLGWAGRRLHPAWIDSLRTLLCLFRSKKIHGKRGISRCASAHQSTPVDCNLTL